MDKHLSNLLTLRALSVPFPEDLIEKVQGNRYVSHPYVMARLLAVLGRPPDQRVVDIIRDHATNRVVGATVEFTFVLPSGDWVVITEVGDVGADPTKKGSDEPVNNEAGLLKNAISDALKRAAMRLGVAIGLWADRFTLPQELVDAAWVLRSPLVEMKAIYETLESAAPDESLREKGTKVLEALYSPSEKTWVDWLLHAHFGKLGPQVALQLFIHGEGDTKAWTPHHDRLKVALYYEALTSAKETAVNVSFD